MTVTIFSVTDAGLPREVGHITVHPGAGSATLSYSPHDTRMNNIVERLTVRLPGRKGRVHSWENPVAWAEALPSTLRTPYLFAEVT